MCTAFLSNILSFHCSVWSASATAAASTRMSLFMISTGMSFLMVMMITSSSFGCKLAFQVCLYCLIRISLSAWTQFNAGLCKCCLSSATDSTTNQNIYVLSCKQSCQCSVSFPIRTDHFTGNHLIIFHFIHFESLCLSKMLENISVVISYCNFHC